MNIKKLNNGLKIVTKELSGTEAVTILVMCGAGSRYETKEISGISHFLEHMFFKGAKKYPDCKSVAEAIDSIGGEFNAFTGKEYVGYYVTVPHEKYEIGMDVLSDMLLHSKFDPVEIDKERGVIIEEMNMYEDLPMQKVHEVFESQIFGDTPLGRDIIGTKELIMSVKQEDFVEYKRKQYTPDNMVIAVTGAISEKEVIEKIEKYFKFENGSRQIPAFKFTEFADSSTVSLVNKPTEQAHLILGVESLGSENFHGRYVTKLLSVILGGNMSSRMFLSIRERQGLCYYIRTSFSGYIGAGYFATAAGVDLKRVDDAIQSILREYELISKKGVNNDELTKAKEYMKGNLTLGLEDSSSIAQFYSQQLIVHGEMNTLSQIKREIDSVSVKEINDMAKSLLKSEKMKFSLIGPYDDDSRFEDILKSL